MSILPRIMGRPLASAEDKGEKVGAVLGIPLLGLDALASAAYGPEAALTILLPLGAAGVFWIGPITGVIIGLLIVFYLSYRQTISAYPNGGGSYTVARENLGVSAGLFAAASLTLDYVLNVAVAISSGIEALTSALPSLQHYTLPLCLTVLGVLTLVNLRGTKESGRTLALPTYLFVVALAGMLGFGLLKAVMTGGHPEPVVRPPSLRQATEGVGLWILLKAFASGCTAMTGVEAISNGIGAFRQPATGNARRTLTGIVVILGLLLVGIASLCRFYDIGAAVPDSPGFQSVISQLAGAVEGRGVLYYVTMASVIAVLCLSANTSFAGLPRLLRLLAEDSFLPHGFAALGQRLVYSQGIILLTLTAGVLLVVFGGITDRLIPLFAIGAFGAFTLSQAGMVGHWLRNEPRRNLPSLLMNGTGAVLTGIALVIVLATKLVEGAWIVLILIPLLALLFRRIGRHYDRVGRQVACDQPLSFAKIQPPIVAVVMSRWSMASAKAMHFAYSLSSEVTVLHVDAGDNHGDVLRRNWPDYIEKPAREAGRNVPTLRMIDSPYRLFITPLLDALKSLETGNPGRNIAVIVPELAGGGWMDYALHNQRSTALKAALLLHGNRRMVVVNVPWYLTRD